MAVAYTVWALIYEIRFGPRVRIDDGAAHAEPSGITQPFPGTRDDSSDFSEPDALVAARLKPRPSLNSGTIALPPPHEPDFEASPYSAFEIALSAVR